ncbi:hypothetical protein [Haloplanus rubicundus]|uniref:Uncharacterized protein n=1 Tax=Haloplanus rubicundus TaxID=1547898 RepID=A0A345E8D7_9EURY|nr:hypothetical protein [Haloplanus rubicundus]AXG08459.1 hypothetical protein DU484_00580 [Haloplanus rubicundus]
MEYRTVADELADWFLETPLDVSMEADMQCRLVERLRDILQNEDALYTTCHNPALTTDGNYAEYKRPYIDRIAESGRNDGSLSRVHPEVNLSDPDGPNEQIDVVVFDDELSYPVSWNGGSKRYDERDVTAAFELKFITNQNVLSNELTTATLRSASKAEMRRDDAVEKLHTTNRKLEHDLNRLNDLPTDDTYLIVFSHYNYLFQPDFLDLNTHTYKKNRKIGWAVDTWLSAEAESGSTEILYAHPGGKTWWSS